jgi:hypothetical protein
MLLERKGKDFLFGAINLIWNLCRLDFRLSD